jgi:hypothetical protein
MLDFKLNIYIYGQSLLLRVALLWRKKPPFRSKGKGACD